MNNELRDKAIAHLTDARRHFAQQQEAEPVAWTLRWPHNIKQGTVNYMTTFKTKERAREYADKCTNGESIVVAPLFLHPPKPAAQPQVPDADETYKSFCEWCDCHKDYDLDPRLHTHSGNKVSDGAYISDRVTSIAFRAFRDGQLSAATEKSNE